MSSTRDTIEITNMERESNETFNEILKIFFYIDWRVWVILVWVITSGLSMYEAVKYCDRSLFYILLSLLPFVNVILYFTIKNICSPYAPRNNPPNRFGMRNGVGIRNKNIYPTPVYGRNKN